MAWRNTHRVGDYLMLDDESGRVHYRSEMVQKWNGNWVRKDQYETRQPQEFVKAKADPYPLRVIRPEPLFSASSDTSSRSQVVGLTGSTAYPVLRPSLSPARSLFPFVSGATTFDVLVTEAGTVLTTETGTVLSTELVTAS